MFLLVSSPHCFGQAAGLRFRLGCGGISPTPPFRRALAFRADGICANVSWRAARILKIACFSLAN